MGTRNSHTKIDPRMTLLIFVYHITILSKFITRQMNFKLSKVDLLNLLISLTFLKIV